MMHEFRVGGRVVALASSQEAIAYLEEALRFDQLREELAAISSTLEDLRAEVFEDAFPLPRPQAVEHPDPSEPPEVIEQGKPAPDR